MYKYISEDGLAKSNDINLVNIWNEITKERERKRRDFIIQLKKQGIKALHPNDGWVDRENNIINFCYPDFIQELRVGDKIALGDYENYSIKTIVEIIPNRIYIDDLFWHKNEYRFE